MPFLVSGKTRSAMELNICVSNRSKYVIIKSHTINANKHHFAGTNFKTPNIIPQ